MAERRQLELARLQSGSLGETTSLSGPGWMDPSAKMDYRKRPPFAALARPMSLQGPVLADRVRRGLSSVAYLRRLCKAAAVSMVCYHSPVEAAACHHYRVWHYPKPQRCYTALAPVRPLKAVMLSEARTEPETRTNRETPTIPLPDLGNITWGTVGPDELRAIALLRALYDAR